ncbi:hypothetical protein SEMRO_417_G138640.1 [Seminavis robusta]|uniref:Uncharacterized protein n=1 Tax=Seminavis robusta TaxID=568900 RepID=A0A9N8E0L4_9STRA|nr:hypothetical protein SEMRO_417_G138640.1 [Seminavis robusta]|eukprot:Sro417_g138640.1 n/a (362) ;mRNA; r:12126-13211
MTSFVAIDHFTKASLTAIPPDEKPTYNSLKVIHQELNANAMAIPPTHGGGHYGHLALVISTPAFNALPNTVPWDNPEHPGAAPVHGAAPTGAQISETNMLFAAQETKFLVFRGTETALQKQLLEAVPDTFTKTLKHEMYGYAQVTALQILTHLDNTYGTIDADDIKDNEKRMNADLSPTQPIEDLYNQVKDAQKFAVDHDVISDKRAISAIIGNLTKSGVFTDALKDWRKTTTAEQTMVALETHFTAADKERRRILTPKAVGYANKATEKSGKATDNKPTPTGNGIPMYYCWSHGLGPNNTHTSNSCSKPVQGHCKEATADNMMGGCCVIRRMFGEKAIYRRPQRECANQNNDENQPPANR